MRFVKTGSFKLVERMLQYSIRLHGTRRNLVVAWTVLYRRTRPSRQVGSVINVKMLIFVISMIINMEVADVAGVCIKKTLLDRWKN